MAQTMITVRGNLGANPDFLPAKTAEDGTLMQAKLSATVYENRRVRLADGTWQDDPRGPLKTTIQLFGRTAETAHRLDMRQGDPVVAGGSLAEPAAFVSPKDGELAARTVITASWLSFDSIRLQQRKDNEGQRAVQPQGTEPAAPAGDASPDYVDEPAF
ncbi:hypothetical protein BLEM_2060 [Bifidobacterium lemurum]|uniref:Single-stranded DNA-binding protein n=1 Tax=Bifidobacterium lemurum TaxID=1603886 RepID=A0A261FLK7_9BIFI|nr:hypothetical protein [Bifidobacterium lemurum]OZG59885.1 hypothetical protein BLEM_2060 [Bifidobacterium lemurum]QOL33915.1 hypothetical protein BL8807_09125 [Bifidobacterium lemurum]